MDPLSIAASAASLAGAASFISVGLVELIKNIKNVDNKIADLSKEVAHLTDLLKSVEQVVRQCQSQALTLAHLDHNMWQQIDNALMDCNLNLQGLDALVSRLSNDVDTEGSNNISRLLKKPSRHFHLTVNKDEIADYTSKIYKSNCAMHTALAVVNVSLTFRANVSQESLFQELHDLKGLVQETLKVSNRQEAVPDPFAARQRKNLASLARAAQKFHIAASSTASTLPGANDRYSLASWGGSEMGGLSDAEVERIEDWKQQLSTVEESAEDSMTEVTGTSGYGDSLTTITSPDLDDSNSNTAKRKEMGVLDEDEDEDDDESDVDYDFLKNFEELAYFSFIEEDYGKAEQLLRQAVERSTGDASGNTDFKKIKLQLALCCCLQEKWDHAIGIITALPKTRSQANLPLFYLLQAITLAHLQGERLDEAYNTCKVVLQGEKKIIGRDSNDYHECLSIFATICERRGNELEAEAVRHSIPRGWRSESPRSPTQYILHHTNLIEAIFPRHNDEQRQTHEETRDERPQVVIRPDTNESNPSPMSPDSSKPPGLDINASASGHWTTLIPNVPRDGFHRAEHDERKGTLIEETDTGKEFVELFVPGISVDLVSEPQPVEPVRRPPPPIPVSDSGLASVGQTQEDRFSRNPWREHLLSAPRSPPPPRPASPKRHAPSRSADLSGVRSGFGRLGISESDMGLGRSFSQRLGSSQAPITEDSGSISRSHSHRQSVASPWGVSRNERSVPNIEVSPPPNQVRSGEQEATSPTVTNPSQDYNRPASHQRLIDQVRQAQELRESHESNSFARRQQQRPPLPRDPYIEQIVTSPHATEEPMPPPEEPEEIEEEPYSTLEVIGGGFSQDYGPPIPTSPIVSPTYASRVRRHNSTVEPRMLRRVRMRWTVQKDICNTGGPRPFGMSGPPQFLPLKRAADPEATYVAVAARFRAPASIVMSKGESGVTMCQLPVAYREQSPANNRSSLDMRRLFRRMSPSGGTTESSQTDSSAFTTGVQNPTDWYQFYNTHELMGTYYHAGPEDRDHRSLSKSNTQLMELEIANMMRHGQATSPDEPVASLRLEGIVYALPDFLDRTFWKYWTDILGDSGLMQHAKVIPQSYAIMQYYLDCGGLSLDYFQSQRGPTSTVVVLNCEEMLVDCVPFNLQLVSPDYVEVVELGTSSMAEMTGSRHARVEFARLVDSRLKVTIRQLRQKIDAATLDGIIGSCCDQFEGEIFPDFQNDGRDWTVDFEMPQGVFGISGRHRFSNAEILRCFAPSVTLIKKMLEQTVERLHDCQESVSYVLLAGHYSSSKYLVSELRKSVSNLRFGNLGPPLEMVHDADQPDLCALGALSHAIGS